jgi:hypothetical protein
VNLGSFVDRLIGVMKQAEDSQDAKYQAADSNLLGSVYMYSKCADRVEFEVDKISTAAVARVKCYWPPTLAPTVILKTNDVYASLRAASAKRMRMSVEIMNSL